MKKRGLAILTLFLIIFLVPIVFAEDKPKLIFVPVDDMYDNLDYDQVKPYLDQSDFGNYLSENDLSINEFEGLIQSGNVRERTRGQIKLYEFLAQEQANGVTQVTGIEVNPHITFIELDPWTEAVRAVLTESISYYWRDSIEGIPLEDLDWNEIVNSEEFEAYRSELKKELVTEGVMRSKGNTAEERIIGSIARHFILALEDKNADPQYSYNFDREYEKAIEDSLAKRGISFDPAKDKVIYVGSRANDPALSGSYTSAGFAYQNSYKIYLGLNMATNSGIHKGKLILADEIHHSGIGDIKFYCDQYSYKHWKRANEFLKRFYFRGCTNEYDPVGCCADNPRWFSFSAPGGFESEAYFDHLDSIGLDQSCGPLACEGKWSQGSKYDVQVSELNRKSYRCIGNPCDLERLDRDAPPYCRDIMGPTITFERYGGPYGSCIGGQFEKETIRPEDIDTDSGYYSSSQD